MLEDVSLSTKDITKEPKPEPNPLMITTCNGSFIDNILVRLFSNPQHVDASNTKIEPSEYCISPMGYMKRIP